MRKKVIICSIAVVAVTAIIILGVGLTRDFIDSQNTINIPDTTTTIIDVTTDEWSIGTDMARNDAFWALRRNNGYVRFMDTDNYTGRIVLADKNGNEIDLDRCSEVPCRYGVDRYMLIFGATVCTLSGLPEENNIFYVYDISDPSDVKWQRLNVEGIALERCDIIYNAGDPFYYLKEKRAGSSWMVLDMSDAGNGVIKKLDFPHMRTINIYRCFCAMKSCTVPPVKAPHTRRSTWLMRIRPARPCCAIYPHLLRDAQSCFSHRVRESQYICLFRKKTKRAYTGFHCVSTHFSLKTAKC